ncbi:MAG: MBOAT family protein [Bacteroidales bacterium]|nr:MBOAT family protein [Bacteroidales bacterium]
MLFNSIIFLVFAAVFFAVFPLIKKQQNFRLGFIVIASFFFYGWWDWRFLFLILGSGLLDYFVGLLLLKNPKRRKLFLLLSVLGNIGSLMAFKYSGFIGENLDLLFASMGMQSGFSENIPDFFLVTPVGISFYTFQSMSYTLDVYKGRLKPTKNVLQFFAYLSMFPQLVAGPIVRAKDLLPQLLLVPKLSEKDRWEGLKLIVHGFFKKMVIADNLAPIVNKGFVAENMSPDSFYWWLIITAFAFQIYCDFSGYSDIARGLARWMGLSFELNFNHPYTSLSLKEFWTRWHISLSSWFRDYLYIAIGGSKKGKFRSHLNMWITMLVSGFWHGAAWTFVIWGGLHAFFMSLERILGYPLKLKNSSLGRIFLVLIVSIQVWVAWVFFRANDFSQAMQIVYAMFSFTGDFSSSLGLDELLFISIGVLREVWIYHGLNKNRFIPKKMRNFTDILLLSLLIAACVFLRGEGSEFIYFQF